MNDVVYHVTDIELFAKYVQTGIITPPVRAWIDIDSALEFAQQTERNVILILPRRAEDKWHNLQGHKHNAVQTKLSIDL